MGNFIADIFTGGATSIGETASNIFKGLIEEFHVPPERALAAQQATIDAANKFILDKAALAQASVDSELKAKQAELDAVSKDRDSARNMTIQLQQSVNSSWLARNVAFCIDIFVALIWGSMTVFLIAKTLHIVTVSPQVDMTTVMGIYTAVSSAFTIILMFHRGSTVSSKAKDETIANLSK